jgi:hypothetical protein
MKFSKGVISFIQFFVITILCVYVDDLLITSNSPNDIVHSNEFLSYKFKSITDNVGLIHSDFVPNGAVEVSMKGYIKQLLIDSRLCSINLKIKCSYHNLKTLYSIRA